MSDLQSAWTAYAAALAHARREPAGAPAARSARLERIGLYDALLRTGWTPEEVVVDMVEADRRALGLPLPA